MGKEGRGLDWVGLPVIATVVRLLCWELTLENEYLRLENRILQAKVRPVTGCTRPAASGLMVITGFWALRMMC